MTRASTPNSTDICRRTVVAWAAAAPLLIGGCFDKSGGPNPSKPPVGTPSDADLPQDGRYRFDFSGDLPG